MPFARDLARQVYAPEIMPAVEAYRAKGIAEGKLRVRDKGRAKVPKAFGAIHNELAARTA